MYRNIGEVGQWRLSRNDDPNLNGKPAVEVMLTNGTGNEWDWKTVWPDSLPEGMTLNEYTDLVYCELGDYEDRGGWFD